ncbi:uncharacterized protein ndufv3 isoform X2 [Narcine bancroftii]|uniref:uncharacterized protein ndufv3 isoform X2 n=1 Tax=Narcine bancroftii TaxID=1343680 RepID=UPI0038319A88
MRNPLRLQPRPRPGPVRRFRSDKMAVWSLGLGLRKAPRILLLERLGLQMTTFTTKVPGEKKKKKIKGARPQEISHGVLPVQAADMTARERMNLLSKKTLLPFPGKNIDPKEIPLAKSWQGSVENSRLGGPAHSEPIVAAHHPIAGEVKVDAASEGSDSSSDSSSDSDEELMTGSASKNSVTFVRRDSPVRNDEWTEERKLVQPTASEFPVKLGIPVSSMSVKEPPTLDEEQIAQEARPRAAGQRNQTEVAAGPPNTKCRDQDGSAGSSQSAELPLAQGERKKDHHFEEEIAADSGTSSGANAADIPLEPVEEPVDEVLDPSTYKNTQHHDYNPLTFVDLDLELAKFRLPQPSSGRLNPRH